MKLKYVAVVRDLMNAMLPLGEKYQLSDEDMWSCVLVSLRCIDSALFDGDDYRRQAAMRVASEVLREMREVGGCKFAGPDSCVQHDEQLNLN